MNQPNGAGMQESDRRVFERVPARVEVRFEEPGQAARALKAYSLNFSAGGLCLLSERHYEVGATLKLELDVAGEHYRFDGVVAWVRGGAVGVRFENVSPPDQARLRALVETLRR